MRLEDFDKAVELKDQMDKLANLLKSKDIRVNSITLPGAQHIKLVKLIEESHDMVRSQLRRLIGDKLFEANLAEIDEIAKEKL